MKVLIATDGSEYSKAAIAESCRFVIQPETTEIVIATVYEDPVALGGAPIAFSGEYYQQIEDALRSLSEGYLSAAETAIRTFFPDKRLKLSSEILRGAPDQQILEKAKEWGADLIVVGSHGRGFWGRLLGSVSDGIVHHAPCSVLVVRKRSESRNLNN